LNKFSRVIDAFSREANLYLYVGWFGVDASKLFLFCTSVENNKPGKKVTRSVLHRGKKHRKKNDKTNFPPIFAQFEQLLPFFSFFFFVLGRIIPSGEAAETMQETLSYGILFLLAPPYTLCTGNQRKSACIMM